MEYIRWCTLAVLILFSLYTIYATSSENFWKSMRTILSLRWGRQVVLDLYIGLLLFHLFVFFNEGSLIMTLAWLVPSLILGNIVPLAYVVVNFYSLIEWFL